MRKSIEEVNRLNSGDYPALSPLTSILRRMFGAGRKRLAHEPSTAHSASKNVEIAGPAIRFEALEPRVLLSGEVNPAALSVNGTLSAPGEKNQYEFLVEESRRVVFDSLTNRSDLNWTLDGPSGQVTNRNFGNTDYYAQSPAFELAPGNYRITVDGQNDAIGDYSLRIIDVDAAADLMLDTEVSGTLDGGNKSALYRFTATAGDKLYFKAGTVSGGAADWRLIDPYGRQEGGTYGLSSDRDVFSLQRSGEYLVVVEGSGSNISPLSYHFNLCTVVDSTELIELNTEVNANIDQPGKVANFTFHLEEDTPVLFDRLTNANFYWSLTGPEGVKVARMWAANAALSYAGDLGRLLLPSGNYTLSVDPYGLATTGSFPFRLLSGEAAQTLQPGAVVTDSLDNSLGSRIYKLGLLEGEQIYLDGRSLSGGALAWRLVDPYGVQVASSALMSPVVPVAVGASGDYWLVLEGADSNTANTTVHYQFAINKVPNLTAALTLGNVVSGSIDIAGQTTVYAFDLAVATQLVFDAQTSRSDLVWSLSGPRGSEVSSRRFDRSDAANGLSILNLPAGSYRLAVRGSGGATGVYAFQLTDLATAEPLSLDTPLAGTLAPGNSTRTYRFSVVAGDKLAFQANSMTGGTATWRLIDRYGRDVAGANNLASNLTALTLTTGGVYTLLVEGQSGNTVPVVFNVQLNAMGTEAQPVLPEGDALSFGMVVAGTLATWDATKIYRFTLDADTLLIMDTQNQSSSSAIWSLVGPRSSEVNQQQLYTSDANYGYPVFSLPAGDYALTVKGAAYSGWMSNNGAYAFRLLDTKAFPELVLGQQTTASRSPSNATLGYRIEVAADSTLILNWSDTNYGSLWSLIDPYGRKISPINGDNQGNTYAIVSAGTYTLLNESYYYATGSSNVTFTLSEQDRTTTPLIFNDQASGSLGGRQSLPEYTFILDRAETMVFDALDPTLENAGNVQWLLRGPQGTVSGWRTLTADALSSNALLPGKYSLLLRNTTDSAAGYQFRVLNRDAAVSLFPGSAVNDTIPVGETRLYRFNANAGERYYFDGQNSYYGTNESCSWSLIDPFGRVINSGYTYYDHPDIQLTANGEYLLALYPNTLSSYSPATAPRYVKFNLIPRYTSIAALTPNQDIEDSITDPAEAVKYSFTLAEPMRILVDAWDGSSFNWSLSGPRGAEASSYGFGNSPRFFDLPTGDYDFVVAANDLSTGLFHFRLTDLASVATIDLDSPVHLSLAGDRAQAYRRFDLATTSELVFDALGNVNPFTSWRLYDAKGQVRGSGYADRDSAHFTLAEGAYYLVLGDRNQEAAQYDVALRRLEIKTASLTLGSTVADALEQPVQENRYTFDVVGPTTLLFESHTNSSDLAWELSGPSGIVLYGTRFNLDGVLARIASAGTYTLRVYSNSNSVGSFGFRLIDVNATAADGLPGPQTLALAPESRTRVFAFDSRTDDFFSYSFGSLAGYSAVQIFLLDVQSNRLFRQDSRYDYSQRLSTPGRYYLVVQAGAAAQTSLDLSFKALLTRNHEQALTLDAANQASLDAGQATDTWTFTLDKDKRLLLDGLASSQVSWMLMDGKGTNLGFAKSFVNPALLELDAGSYRLVIAGNSGSSSVPGSYAFRLLDTAAASELGDGVPTTGTLFPLGAGVFKLSVQAGQQWYVAVTGAGADGRVTIFDTRGNVVAAPALPEAGAEFGTGNQAGDYLVVVDGDPAQAEGLGYTLTATRAQEHEAWLLTDGSKVNDALGEDGTRRYHFAVARSSLLWLDVLDAPSGRWSVIDAQGNQVASGGLDGTGGTLISITAPGTYTLSFVSDTALPDAIAFQLANLATSALAIDSDTRIDGELDPGTSTRIYRFNALSEDSFKFVSYGANSSDVRWHLFSQSGGLLANGNAGESSSRIGLNYQGAGGQYYLLIDGMSANTSAVTYAFAASLNRIAFETPYSGIASYYSPTSYKIHLDQPARLLFDAYKPNSAGSADYYAYWALTGVDGQVFSGSLYQNGRDSMLVLAAGDYTLRVFSSYYWYSVPYQFRVLTQAGAEAFTPGTPVSGTLAPGNSTKLYRFDATAGDSYYFRGLQSISGYWRLIDPEGKQVFDVSSLGNRDAVRLAKTGTYLLAVEGYNNTFSAQDYSFSLIRPEDKGLVALNSTASGSLAAGAIERYQLHLAQAAMLVFDNLDTNTSLQWRLQRADAVVFDQKIASNDNYVYDPVTGVHRYINDFGGQLPAGDYSLFLNNTGATPGSYSFRILDQTVATKVAPGTPVSTVVTPSNGAQLFTFDAVAGERYYFDALATQSALLDTAVSQAVPQWTLLDPLGRAVFSKANMGWAGTSSYWDSALGRYRYRNVFTGYDQELTALAMTGTYTLMVEGRNTESRPQANVSFNVVKVPNNPPVVLDTVVIHPAPDLAVNSVVLDPAETLLTGQVVNIRWVVENRGVQPASGKWSDRVVVRNLDTGALVANLTVPYDAALAGDIAAGESRSFSATLQLPAGSWAAGRLGFHRCRQRHPRRQRHGHEREQQRRDRRGRGEPGAIRRSGRGRPYADARRRLPAGGDGRRHLDDLQPGNQGRRSGLERTGRGAQLVHQRSGGRIDPAR